MRKLKFNYLTASLRARPQCLWHALLEFHELSSCCCFIHLCFCFAISRQDKKLKKYRRIHAARDRQVYYSQHQIQITTNKICLNGVSLLLQCAAAATAAVASVFVSVTGYHISIINPFILLTFITRSDVVDDDDGRVWLSGWVCVYALRILACG